MCWLGELRSVPCSVGGSGCGLRCLGHGVAVSAGVWARSGLACRRGGSGKSRLSGSCHGGIDVRVVLVTHVWLAAFGPMHHCRLGYGLLTLLTARLFSRMVGVDGAGIADRSRPDPRSGANDWVERRYS